MWVTHACTFQVAVENQVRTLRHRWELVKRGDLLGFLASPTAVEMPPQLESSVTEMTRSLRSLFSVLFCTSRGEPSINQQLLATISQIKETLQTRLADYEDYLLVKGQRNVTMTAYPFHGLQSFLYRVKLLYNLCYLCAEGSVISSLNPCIHCQARDINSPYVCEPFRQCYVWEYDAASISHPSMVDSLCLIEAVCFIA